MYLRLLVIVLTFFVCCTAVTEETEGVGVLWEWDKLVELTDVVACGVDNTTGLVTCFVEDPLVNVEGGVEVDNVVVSNWKKNNLQI